MVSSTGARHTDSMDDWVEDLINLWREQECLYNNKIPSYHDRDKKRMAFQSIQQKLNVETTGKFE